MTGQTSRNITYTQRNTIYTDAGELELATMTAAVATITMDKPTENKYYDIYFCGLLATHTRRLAQA